MFEREKGRGGTMVGAKTVLGGCKREGIEFGAEKALEDLDRGT